MFDSVLHLHRLGWFVAEAFDEVLHLGDFSLLVFVGAELLFTAFMAEADVVVIAHLVVRDSSAGDFHRSVCHLVDEGSVVADEEDGAR